MCWVMPPASPATTFALRIASSRLGLTVVDVTHDGDDRRTDLEVLVGLVLELLVEVDVEALEELLVLVLGRDDLDLVAELLAEHLEGGLVERLGRRRHLTEVEQHGHERTGVRRRSCRRSREIDAPRRRRMTVLPSPRGTLTPPSDGASRISNSCRFVRFDLRALLLPPPRPKAPAVPPPGPRPRPPPPAGRGPPKPPAPGAPPGRWNAAAAGTRAGTGTGAAGTLLEAAAGAAGTPPAPAGTRVRRDAGRRDGEPAGRGMLPGLPGAGPCPARSRTGCCPGAGCGGALAHALRARANGLLPGRGAPGRGAGRGTAAAARGGVAASRRRARPRLPRLPRRRPARPPPARRAPRPAAWRSATVSVRRHGRGGCRRRREPRRASARAWGRASPRAGAAAGAAAALCGDAVGLERGLQPAGDGGFDATTTVP